jgi:polar amino acid transport system substrate-binding protein
VFVGTLIATGRVYGAAPARAFLTAYVEIVRGTPLLLQLFVLYFGLAAVVPVAGIRGGADRAWPQLRRVRERDLSWLRSKRSRSDSWKLHARSAFSDLQTLRLIRGPQAFRLALAPMTNDFVAL